MATEVKPRSNRILLIFGFVVAIVAFGLNLLLARTNGGGASISGGPKNVPVAVATKDIAPSTQITADMVTITFYSADQAPPFAFRAKDGVVGKYATVPIHVNQPISDNLLVTSAGAVQPQKQPFLEIPSGQVAMQVPTGELVGVGGYIQPDDRIDIIVTLNQTTRTTFKNLKILRVGPAGGANTRGISSSLTVIVTLQQAEELKLLLDQTNFKYVLKSVKDYDVPDPDTPGIDLNSFKLTYRLR